MPTTAEPTKTIIESAIATGMGPLDLLEQLDSLGIEWFVTRQGDVMIKAWQVGAEGFVSPSEVPLIQRATASPDADPLNWVSEHLRELREQYSGQWIAVLDAQVRAAAPSLPALLALVSAQGLQKPFVTQLPVGATVWTMTYADQEF